jgi:DNA-binding transcriptional MerR regulator
VAQRRLTQGKVEQVEFTPAELAELFSVTADQLESWQELIPAAADGVYRYASADDFRRIRHRVLVLATGMTTKAVEAVEAEGLLAAYAALARDCPSGVTAHVWRSYAIVVLMQTKQQRMIDAEELAVRARLMEQDPISGELVPSVAEARKHLKLLQATNQLVHTGMQWQHQGLPLCMRGA